MGLSRQEYCSGFPFPPPVEMELLKFPAYNIVLKFFWKKKKRDGGKKEDTVLLVSPKFAPSLPKGMRVFFSWYLQDWEWSSSFIYVILSK